MNASNDNATLTRFEPGRTYTCRSVCDHNCIFSYEVVRRTESSVWLKAGGKVTRRAVRVCPYEHHEMCDPQGRYSMSPVLRARG